MRTAFCCVYFLYRLSTGKQMLISGRTQAQESRYQRAKIGRVAAQYNRTIAKEIQRAMNEAANSLGDPLAEDRVRNTHAKNLFDILSGLWIDSGNAAVSGTFKIAKSFLMIEFKRDITTPIVDAAIADWIKAYAPRRITEITATTGNDIRSIVANAREDGLSERDTARLIREIAPIKSASRAQTIARTEAHGSSQGISLDVANQTDIPMKKVWLSSELDRTRDHHADANGQVRALSEKFDVDGEAMDYPGDPSGSAANVINCRCVIGYEVA